jgi:hypothetical protein
LSGPPILTVCQMKSLCNLFRRLTSIRIEWQWEQLRVMKVGGNESATKFFQSNGGTAALASKDPKVKYTSNAATKYKDELKRRAARDSQE